MIWELIHTSVPHGLKPGSRGYTTVAQTEGMPAWLSEALGEMSAYPNVTDTSGANAGKSLPVYRHARLVRTSESYSVLSRIASCSDDYSRRSNHIAHHLALDASARGKVSGGPLSLFSREGSARVAVPAGPLSQLPHDGLFCREWKGDPQHLEERSGLPNAEVRPQPCRSWERATGDAGWAGEVLKRVLDGRPGGLYLRYQSDHKILELLSEASALLPPKLRWNLTFQVGSMNDPPRGLDCVLRCVPQITGIANTISGMGAHNTIDLSKVRAAGKKAPDSPYAKAARSGKSVEIARPPVAAGGEKLIVSAPSGQESLQRADAGATSYPPADDLLRVYEPEPAKSPSSFSGRPRGTYSAPKRRGRLTIALAAALACMIGVSIGVPIGRLSLKSKIESLTRSDEDIPEQKQTASDEEHESHSTEEGLRSKGNTGSLARGKEEIPAQEQTESAQRRESPSNKERRPSKGRTDLLDHSNEGISEQEQATGDGKRDSSSSGEETDDNVAPNTATTSGTPGHAKASTQTRRTRIGFEKLQGKVPKNIEYNRAVVTGSDGLAELPKEWVNSEELQVARLVTKTGSESIPNWEIEDDSIVETDPMKGGAPENAKASPGQIAKVTANWNEDRTKVRISLSKIESNSNKVAGLCLLHPSEERALLVLWDSPKAKKVDLQQSSTLPRDGEWPDRVFIGEGAIQVEHGSNGSWEYKVNKDGIHVAEFKRQSDKKVLFRIEFTDPRADKPQIRVLVAAEKDIAKDGRHSTQFLKDLREALKRRSEETNRRVQVPNIFGVTMVEIVFPEA